MELLDYKYTSTVFGWEVTHKGVIVAGLSRNINLVRKQPGIEWYEYHRDCAKEALKKLISK